MKKKQIEGVKFQDENKRLEEAKENKNGQD